MSKSLCMSEVTMYVRGEGQRLGWAWKKSQFEVQRVLAGTELLGEEWVATPPLYHRNTPPRISLDPALPSGRKMRWQPARQSCRSISRGNQTTETIKGSGATTVAHLRVRLDVTQRGDQRWYSCSHPHPHGRLYVQPAPSSCSAASPLSLPPLQHIEGKLVHSKPAHRTSSQKAGRAPHLHARRRG
jgi:hypothetical protein